jgi:hypothetical protein
MDEESDEELEELNKLLEPCVQCYSSSQDEDNTELDVTYWARKDGDAPVSDFTGFPNGLYKLAAPNINAESSPF